MYIDDGFSHQTAKTLRQFGADDLIKEVKKRDISTDVLYKLTKEDFIRLGASEEQAEHLVTALSDGSQNTPLILQTKLSSLTEILKQGQEQLSLLHTLSQYCRVKLEKKTINTIVDADKNIHASNIFCDASEAIYSQIHSIQQAMKELEYPTKIMNTTQDECKPLSTRRHLSVVVSGISLVLCTVLYMFKNKTNFQIFMKH